MKNRKFDYCNVISNRIISNSVITKSEEFVLVGCFLKQLVFDLSRINNNEDKDEFSKKIENYLKKIEKTNDINIILTRYYDLIKNINVYFTTEEEKSFYQNNLKFTHYSIEFLVKFLISELNEDKFIHSINNIFIGFLNEIERFLKLHDFTLKELLLKFIMIYSSKLYEYYRIFIINDTQNKGWYKKWEIYQVLIKKNLDDYLNKEEQEYIKQSIKLLFELCKEWRFMFIRLLEPIQKLNKIEKEVELPHEIKEKIQDLAKKAIDEDLEHNEG
ncbi:MAG: hypothetical protein K9W44_14805 [Candidatus Lokiarchaeota archaeon]|nr:hypothetical protein [Candidatus Harpocratesius repetitus]